MEIYNDWESIEEAFNKACNMPRKPGKGFERLKVGTVIDEDKTVRWNREEVERRNAAYEEERHRLEKEANDAYHVVHTQAVKLVAQETGLSDELAEILWSFVYDKCHADGCISSCVEEYIDLINKILK